jgi:hypothetical protein
MFTLLGFSAFVAARVSSHVPVTSLGEMCRAASFQVHVS